VRGSTNDVGGFTFPGRHRHLQHDQPGSKPALSATTLASWRRHHLNEGGALTVTNTFSGKYRGADNQWPYQPAGDPLIRHPD
jgi:hypothetical protein